VVRRVQSSEWQTDELDLHVTISLQREDEEERRSALDHAMWEVIDTEGRLEQGGRSIRASRSTRDGVDSKVGHEIAHRSQTGRLLGDCRMEG
jgi:hypothetical protein